MRGSAPQQVGIFLDGVPLGSSFAGLVNLSDITLDGIGRIEVYRGHVPVAFGGATLGGAINLVSKLDWERQGAHVRAGYGSFGARQVGTDVTVQLRPGLQLGARMSYGGAQGDFTFYDDAGTNVFTGDDRQRKRTNNDYDRVLAQVRLDGERGSLQYSVQQWFTGRRSGIAGPVGAPSESARLDTYAGRTLASVEQLAFGRAGGTLSWFFGLGLARQRFADPDSELGVNVDDQRMSTVDGYVSPRWRVPLWRGAYLGLVSDLRPEFVDIDERVADGSASGSAPRSRIAVGAGIELEQFLFDRRWLLVPVVHVDGQVNRFAAAPGQGELGDEGRDDVTFGFAPRLGSRLRIVQGLEVRASGGRYFRAPTLLELFGDRGYIVGNEGLRPERGTAIDAGVVVDLKRPMLAIYAQLAGFASWSEDLIQWIAAGRVTRPENISKAAVRGLEASVSLEPPGRQVTLSAHYTLTRAVDRGNDPTFRDRTLPGRPRHDVFARATAGHEWSIKEVRIEPRLLFTAEFTAGTFLDPAERFELPPRLLQGLGIELHVERRVHFACEIRNLLDVRTAAVTFPVAGASPTPVAVSDFLGFPLPGRSVWASLTFDFEFQKTSP